MKIVPVNFNKEHKAILGHCKMIVEDDRGKIAINPDKFDKLITSLRTAVDIDGTLDKEATSYNDIFDAFRLALKFYHYEEITYYSYLNFQYHFPTSASENYCSDCRTRYLNGRSEIPHIVVTTMV